MGRISIIDDGQVFEAELNGRTLIGRHWSAQVVLQTKTVPQFWVELRWRNDEWCWRVLSEGSRTRGVGERRDSDWRKLQLGIDGNSGRIRCSESVSLQLIDAQKPQPFARSLADRKEWLGKDLERLLFDWQGDGFRRNSTEFCADELQDGDLLVIDGQLVEIYPALDVAQDLEVLVSVCSPSTYLDIDLEQLQATFTQDEMDVFITGEPVRTLAVFAQARIDDMTGMGGWLSAEDAYGDWLAVGGNARSHPGRLGWERGKLRAQLNKANAENVSELFQVSRRAAHPGCRLNIPRSNITIQDSSS